MLQKIMCCGFFFPGYSRFQLDGPSDVKAEIGGEKGCESIR